MHPSDPIDVYDSQTSAYHRAFQVFLDHTDQKAKAREWLDLIARGIDPKVEEERRRAAQHVSAAFVIADPFGAFAFHFHLVFFAVVRFEVVSQRE